MTRRRFVLLSVPVLIAGMATGSAGSASASLPPGTTSVTPTANNVTPSIDASVNALGSIAGTIRSVANPDAVESALITVFNGNGKSVGFGASDSSGAYEVDGLKPSSGYTVCVNAQYAHGGGSTTGYLSRCYPNAAWTGVGGPPASGITTVPVSGGAQATANVALKSAAAIQGKLTSTGGAALPNATILGVSRNTGRRFYAVTGGTGTYRLIGLTPASKGYTVCFGGASTSLSSATGYLNECWTNVPWNGLNAPSGTDPVSVQVGQTHTGISAAVGKGGAVAGTVTDAVSGNPRSGAIVTVFSATGKALNATGTNSNGHYALKSLRPASSDYVCVAPDKLNLTTVERDYKGTCYQHVTWNGNALPSSGLTGVRVRAGQVHGNINLAQGRTVIQLGYLAGKITDSQDSNAIAGAEVDVYTAGGSYRGSDFTDSTGLWKVAGLRANSTGYVACALAPNGTAVRSLAAGYAPRCYQTAAWDGSSTLPSGATKVPLAAGAHKGNVNIALTAAGGISGDVTVAGSGDRVSVSVNVYNSAGRIVNSAFASTFGTPAYTVTGLRPGRPYTVCFDGRFLGGAASAPYGTAPQCYNGVAWTP